MASKFIQWKNEELLEGLSSPVVIAAFEGWNDAGEAATSAVKYFQDRFDAVKIGTIESEEFFDFTISRPVIEIPDEQREIIWPATKIYVAKMFESKNDLVIIRGHEPQLRWRTFTDQIIEIASTIESHMVVTLGSLLTDIPHSRPVKVFGSSDDSDLAQRLNLPPSTYEGPTGIVGVINSVLREKRIPSMSLWAGVPSYVSGANSPKAALALVERLAEVLQIGIACTDLEIASAAYERQINELVAEDMDTSEYVNQLEEDFDNQSEVEEQNSNPELLVSEVEDFLRNQTGQT
ncbi:MAG: PAC2 family protein [Acidimicrobiales bacterium]|jgi:proteasome assembly chaperone (PAC2) family protein|nr:carboxylate--amine ligase [Acidimicrobiaceae bacterium]MDP6322588.1 PAC2 family protein [Acidimicrobiales bacterium]MDP6894497.1 PAC2 family protein [Acidimicrobiales bacterium]|tara:strand:- start:360 stop:1235 length:876 start_codon:yes stop_codon:yes gene_type:complete